MNILHQIGIWGDSVLKGIVFNDSNGRYEILADHCANRLQDHLGISILNRSRFGCTITKGRLMLEKALADGLDCDMVMLEYGGNDCDFNWQEVSDAPEKIHKPRTERSDFVRQYRDMIEMLTHHGIKPLLMSLPPIDAQRYLDHLVAKGLNRDHLLAFLHDTQQIYRYHESYSLAITQLARETGCLYVPVRESLLASEDYLSLLCMDGIHPNEQGHRKMEQVFMKMAAAMT